MSTTLSIRRAQRSDRLCDALPMPDTPPSTRQAPSTQQVNQLISAIAHKMLSPDFFNQSLYTHLSSTHTLTQQLAESVTETTIATQYTQTCLSLWQLAQVQSTLESPREAFPQPLLQPLLQALPQHLSKLSFAQQQFMQQLTQLCVLWAIGKWQRPAHPFFAHHPTAFAALQAKWQNPAIQIALREATAHLLQSPQELWIETHTDGWAYLLGRIMHQLLQWNYQLTPSSLGELLQRDEGKSDDTKPDAR
ncbi:MAG: hypothetical protein AAGJ69_05395 [Cyanobacteria bacterium J06559_1]